MEYSLFLIRVEIPCYTFICLYDFIESLDKHPLVMFSIKQLYSVFKDKQHSYKTTLKISLHNCNLWVLVWDASKDFYFRTHIFDRIQCTCSLASTYTHILVSPYSVYLFTHKHRKNPKGNWHPISITIETKEKVLLQY